MLWFPVDCYGSVGNLPSGKPDSSANSNYQPGENRGCPAACRAVPGCNSPRQSIRTGSSGCFENSAAGFVPGRQRPVAKSNTG